MNRLVLPLCLTLGGAAWPQDTPDASSVPDASVGQGGAEQTSEENDQGAPCLDSSTCELGSCINGRCVPTKPRTIGCGAVPVVPVLALGLLAFARRRRW